MYTYLRPLCSQSHKKIPKKKTPFWNESLNLLYCKMKVNESILNGHKQTLWLKFKEHNIILIKNSDIKNESMTGVIC